MHRSGMWSPIVALGSILLAFPVQAQPTIRPTVTPRLTVTQAETPTPKVMERLTTPVTRTEAVAALLASQAMRQRVASSLPEGIKLEDLGKAAVSGNPMPLDVLPRVSDQQVAARPVKEPDDDRPPRSVEDLQWERGVYLRPLKPAPSYQAYDGRTPQTYYCARMWIHGVSISSHGLINDPDVTTHDRGESAVDVYLHLPDHSGTYLLSFQLAYGVRGALDAERMRAVANLSTGSSQLLLARQPPTGGYEAFTTVVALLDLPPGNSALDASPTGRLGRMQQVTASIVFEWPFEGGPSWFGGLTVTKL